MCLHYIYIYMYTYLSLLLRGFTADFALLDVWIHGLLGAQTA